MTASQFAEWVAYADLEPFGAVQENKLIGMVCSTIANFSMMRVKEGSKDKFWVPEDFVPDPLKPKEEVKATTKQTIEEQALVLRTIAAGSKKRKKR